jgi:predicted transcriptional regulator
MPNKIDIGDDRENAAEHGEWVGMWKSPNGFTERRGCYLAGWRRVNGRWLLQSELFISLKWM